MTDSTKGRGKLAALDLIDEARALQVVPERPAGAHKWSVGGVIVVGGSPGYLGAPALSAMAAGRSGAGIVLVACPRGAIGAVASIVPEAAFIPMPEADLGAGGWRATERISERIEKARALVVGPGLGTDEYADAVMSALFAEAVPTPHAASLGFSAPRLKTSASRAASAAIVGKNVPAVIDADGLNWLAKRDEWWIGLTPKSCVLTPHVGEMARLTGAEAEEILADPAKAAREAAKRWDQIVLLKGSPTVVTDGETVVAAEAAPRALATAGTGDVLSGSIGAFLAQGLAPFDAAMLAVYCGCRAAARLTERIGTLGVVASDLPLAIAEELKTLEERKATGHA